MLIFIAILLLAFLTLVAISLQRTYTRIPPKELRRRAAKGDELAQTLYRVVAYGASLRVILWIITGLSAAGFFVVLATAAPSWLAMLASLILLWVGFAWLPQTKLTKTGNYIARTFASPLAWILNHLYPLLSRLSEWARKRGRIHIHTGLYEKDDLLELLAAQKQQPDNRISEQELTIVRAALKFGDKLVQDVMTPRRAAKMVSVKDSIGPVLMGELHESGFSRFPVYQDKEDHIVGTLYLHDLVAVKSGGVVSNFMDKKVFYMHDQQTLNHVLQAFLKTKHHMFVVVNNFEEFVGIITIEDVLEQILGQPITDEFDKYDNLREVAKLEAAHIRKARVGKTLKE